MNDDQPFTLRRRSLYCFGWVVILAGLAATAGAIWHRRPGVNDDDIFYVVFMLSLMWLCWQVAVHPKIVVNASEVLVINWFRRFVVPWSAVARIDRTNDLTLVLHSGEKIRPAIGSGSVVSMYRGNSTQRRVAAVLEQWRRAAPVDEDAVVVRRLDVKPVPFVVFGVVLLVVEHLFQW